MRNKKDIIDCYKLIQKNKHDIVLTMCKTERNPGYNMVYKKKNKIKLIPTRVVIKHKTIFDLTTVAYICNKKYIENKNAIFDGSVGAVEIPKERSIDIDTIDDLMYASYLLNKK